MMSSSLCLYCILFLGLLSSFSISRSSLKFSSFTCSVPFLSCFNLTVAFFTSFCNSELLSCNNLMSLSLALQIFCFFCNTFFKFSIISSYFLHYQYWVSHCHLFFCLLDLDYLPPKTLPVYIYIYIYAFLTRISSLGFFQTCQSVLWQSSTLTVNPMFTIKALQHYTVACFTFTTAILDFSGSSVILN